MYSVADVHFITHRLLSRTQRLIAGSHARIKAKLGILRSTLCKTTFKNSFIFCIYVYARKSKTNIESNL